MAMSAPGGYPFRAALIRINANPCQGVIMRRNLATEIPMSFGNLLYLILVGVMFSSFGIVLAYMSHQQSKLGPEMLGDTPRQPKPVQEDHLLAA
jgi:hypothetical protein